ncbi:MAG: hypothetical protein M3495_20470 [Pseudomonadota bacterium]|nr:hypothetical protein [Gammaproteobacteria bacterium]MDQ3583825.1 hypothetical protein [Pseudomonadota bacterium]
MRAHRGKAWTRFTGPLALAACAAVAQAQDLGRLFTTPQEREMLEALRRQPPKPQTEAAPVVAPAVESAPVVPNVTMNGLVRRSRGRGMVWVNGVTSLEGDLDAQGIAIDVGALRGTTLPVRIGNAPLAVGLKPGQTYDTGEAEVREGYQPAPAGERQRGPDPQPVRR